MKRAILLLLLLASASSEASPSCAVESQPRVALAPLRFIRSKVTIERGSTREAQLTLVDELGEITSGAPRTDVRTQWIEWKNIVLGPGEYQVVLQTSSCLARSSISVRGE